MDNLLANINYPDDLRKLPPEKLPQICDELRCFLIESVSKSGGHFGSNLGVVELTVALHYVFKAPGDKLIWDVGHQAYPHKILTGRRDKMFSIRKKGGLAPFPKREESEYDALSVGHASTSLSAALGMAAANIEAKESPAVVAVIGDGALNGGMALEALNHAGDIKADILFVINDNRMSISESVGAIERYLSRMISSPTYVDLRGKGRDFLENMPGISKLAKKAERYAKGMLTPGTLFEELGFEYFGPVDGHDPLELVEILRRIKNIKGPRILHVVTKKGKGYLPAEIDRCRLHATKPFDMETGQKAPVAKKATFTDAFSFWAGKKAENDLRLHAITPAMCEGSGLSWFREKFPNRFHDVGIAEQHAVTFGAGLALGGKKPVIAIYSSFLQRSFDQVFHDVCYQNADVLFAIDRSGAVGPDGPTHNGIYDLSYLRIFPNLMLMAPKDENECIAMLEIGYEHPGPAAVRYPRGGEKGEFDQENISKLEVGKAEIVRRGKDVAILAFGPMAQKAANAAKKFDATLVNMRFVKPLDEGLLRNLARNHELFITVEDNVIAGGAGSAVNEFFMQEGLSVKIRNLGFPDRFLEQGTRDEVLAQSGLDEGGIQKSVSDFIQRIQSAEEQA